MRNSIRIVSSFQTLFVVFPVSGHFPYLKDFVVSPISRHFPFHIQGILLFFFHLLQFLDIFYIKGTLSFYLFLETFRIKGILWFYLLLETFRIHWILWFYLFLFPYSRDFLVAPKASAEGACI